MKDLLTIFFSQSRSNSDRTQIKSALRQHRQPGASVATSAAGHVLAELGKSNRGRLDRHELVLPRRHPRDHLALQPKSKCFQSDLQNDSFHPTLETSRNRPRSERGVHVLHSLGNRHR
jgi:hypothetical protein